MADPLSTLPDWWALLSGSISYGDTRDSITNGISPTALLSVPFGQVRIGGTVLYVKGLGGDSLTHGQGVVAWSEGEIESIDAITGNAVGFTARSDDAVTITLAQHHGEPGGETNPGNIFGSPKPSFAGCAYTYFDITVPSGPDSRWWDYLPGGLNAGPATSGVAVPWAADIHGLKLYDPRLDSTNGGSGSHRYADPTTWAYSNNPILIARYLLVKYGRLVNGVDIDDSNIAAMADVGDAQGFTCDVVFAAKTTVRDALAVVLQTCNGTPISVNGKAGFWLDVAIHTDPVGTFDEAAGDIWGLKYEWLSTRDCYTQLAVSFNNRLFDYKPDQTPFYGDSSTFSSEPTKTISSVNPATDTVTLASSPGWAVNDAVRFDQFGGDTISGLNDGGAYFVKTISGADVTLTPVVGGATCDLTGTTVITTQFLQRIGDAYPPTVFVKPLVVNAPGIATLMAAYYLRDYLFKSSATIRSRLRVSGTMSARGIGLQVGQKIHVTTLKGLAGDALLLQISGDQSGFFSFVVKPYYDDVYITASGFQQGPIVTHTAPSDINVTDRTQTLEVLTSTDSTHDNYDVFQLIEYVLPLNYAATIDHLAVRGSESAGAGPLFWDDLAASEISVSTAGNATATDGTHENLYHTAVRRATRAITYSTRPTVLSDVTTERTYTRIIVKSIGADGSASNGVTVDYTAGVGPSAPPTPVTPPAPPAPAGDTLATLKETIFAGITPASYADGSTVTIDGSLYKSAIVGTSGMVDIVTAGLRIRSTQYNTGNAFPAMKIEDGAAGDLKSIIGQSRLRRGRWGLWVRLASYDYTHAAGNVMGGIAVTTLNAAHWTTAARWEVQLGRSKNYAGAPNTATGGITSGWQMNGVDHGGEGSYTGVSTDDVYLAYVRTPETVEVYHGVYSGGWPTMEAMTLFGIINLGYAGQWFSNTSSQGFTNLSLMFWLGYQAAAAGFTYEIIFDRWRLTAWE